MDFLVRSTILLLTAGASIAAAFVLRWYFSRAQIPRKFDPQDAGVKSEFESPLLIEFTSPYCYECQVALPVLSSAAREHGAELSVIDVRDRPDLLRKYEIRSTPTILVVDRAGKVRGGWLNSPDERELALALTAAG